MTFSSIFICKFNNNHKNVDRSNMKLTKYVLHHRGVNVSAICPCCNRKDESIPHCLILCPRAVAVWSGCEFPNVSSLCINNPSSNMRDIIQMLLSKIGSVAPIIMWNLSCTRNKLVFDGIQLIVRTAVSAVYAQLQVSHWLGPLMKYAANMVITNPEIHALMIGIKLCWEAGYKKLGNSCADILAKQGTNQSESLVMVHQPLSCLSLALLADATRVSFIRT
ncbi:hypothetical protein MTR_8g076330 [Medicago truncatula]|uniref:Reverse transcriptase zinc-binding domain-containing protein n=1 Tax=Medicago truncatula TaxID=3880 RepID=G7LD09_MEDTR|nr:hypothetical protein MTR_8g076330 [Medicago truncatula]